MPENGDNRRLSATSTVTLGMAVLIAGGVWRAGEKVAELEDKLEQRFVTREVFELEMGHLREAFGDLRTEVAGLRHQPTEPDERPQR